jgi:hypothetical protein
MLKCLGEGLADINLATIDVDVQYDLCRKETHYHRKNTNKNVRDAVGPCAKVSSKYHDLPLSSKFSQILVEQECECPHDKSYNPNHY